MRIRPVLAVLAVALVSSITVASPAHAAGGHDPFGAVDLVSPDGKYDVMSVFGWVIDPDFAVGENNVALYVDGRGIAWFPTGRSRPDVQAVYPAHGGDNGFYASFPNPSRGQHELCAYAINRGAGGNTLIRCTPFVVTVAADLVGHIDRILRTSPTTYVADGWVLNAGDAVSPTPFWLLPPGNTSPPLAAASGSAGLDRPDVDAVYPHNGTHHGFSQAFTVPLDAPVVEMCLASQITATTTWRITPFCGQIPQRR